MTNYDPDLMRNIMGSPARKVVVPTKRRQVPTHPSHATPVVEMQARADKDNGEGAKKWRSITVRLSNEEVEWMRKMVDSSRSSSCRITFGDIVNGGVQSYLKDLAARKTKLPDMPVKAGPGRPVHYGSSDVQIHLGFSEELAEGLHELATMIGTRSYSVAARIAVDYARGALR